MQPEESDAAIELKIPKKSSSGNKDTAKTLIQHIDNFRNSLLNEKVDVGAVVAEAINFAKVSSDQIKSNYERHKSLSLQENKWHQQRISSMKMRASNDLSQRRISLQNTFGQTRKAFLVKAGLEQISEDTDDNNSNYLMTDQSMDRNSKH